MRSDLDLCVKNRGQWSIYRLYPAAKRQDAMKDASYLKSSGQYEAVMLLDDGNQQVIFSYTAKGGARPSYATMRRNLKESSSVRMRPKTKARVGAKPRQTTKATSPAAPASIADKESYIALRVGISGFALTLITLTIMGMSGAGFASIAVTFLLMGGLTIVATIGVYSFFEGTPPAKQEAKDQLMTQKKLQKTEEVFTDAFVIGKSKIWDREKQAFKDEGHFALILYMLGMSQGFKQNIGTRTDATNRQIANLFSTVGIAPESITNCAGNLPEYLAYPKYNAVYQRGLSDVNKLVNDDNFKLNLESVLSAWKGTVPEPNKKEQTENKSEDKTEKAPDKAHDKEEATPAEPEVPESNFALVMFTDIVGSTESIRHKGDRWMVDVLQAHNSIVREAINAFGGHEVKHTGDGIMMSFPAVEKGVKASIAIQKGIAAFNKKVPDRAFPVRVGMSAGEPMRLEGDLFGLPVNLAARVLPYADAFEVAMSQDCHKLCAEMPYTFTSKAECNFKGFDEPQTVYFLQWQDEKTPEADAPGVVGEPASSRLR